MTTPEFDLFASVGLLQARLAQAGIPSATIGGLAVAVWGEPRLTRDADVKVLLDREERRRLIEALADDYRLVADDPDDTLRRFGMLFVLDPGGVRIDLLLGETAFDAAAIERARAVPGLGESGPRVCSPEDLIIYKLLSTRPRDHDDVIGIIRRQSQALDDAYVILWLRQFEIALDDSELVRTYRRLRSAESG
jgi:hypothetical protein